MLAQQILDFYARLHLPDAHLPKGVKAMNPYAQAGAEVQRVLGQFYQKYYADAGQRELILGINPGRMGAGLTGIPFTDTPALVEHCGIATSIDTRETSAQFVYRLVDAYGGAEAFFGRWFIGAACPLGFIYHNQKGNWVNYNYYDSAALYRAVKDFMLEQLKLQHALCGHPQRWIVLGTGKNYRYLSDLNQELQLATTVVALEHPRYVMQYKRVQLEHYLKKFLEVLG